jgi:hypothetical protein
MSRFQFIYAMRFMAGFVLALLMVVYFLGHEVYIRVKGELEFRDQYGAEWKQHYLDEHKKSVEETNTEIMVAVGGLGTLCVLSYLIYRQVTPRRSVAKGRSRRRRSGSWSIPT